ncbi:hypothetical protein LPJ64_006135, partial [Coemansia asiatica]
MSESTAISVHSMQHNAMADHPQKSANPYYQDSAAAAAAAAAAVTGVISNWAGDSNQYHSQQKHPSQQQHPGHNQNSQQYANATDTSCSSPQETPLARIIQQQAGSVSVSSSGLPTHPTPPQSAHSHGFAQGDAAAWRAYPSPYQQGIPMSAPYTHASFASSISAGIPIGLDGSSFDHSTAAAAAAAAANNGGSTNPVMAGDYYSNGVSHSVGHQQPSQHHYQQMSHSSAASGTMVSSSAPSQANGIADIHHHHHQQQQHYVSSQQHQDHHHHQQQQQQQHQFQQDASVSQFDPTTAAAAAAASGGAYMSDFGHGMYAAPEIASAPASATHLPPIDPTNGLPRHNSYFGMPTAPSPSAFDQMSAAAAAAAAAATGPYSPHAPSPGHYLAAARGQHPYPPMIMGRFNLGMPSAGTPGAVPNQSPVSVMGGHGSMSVPGTPVRPMGLPRVNSHNQSSTSQRKRYLCTVCQKMFARPSTLATHMHSHTGEKPYECTWDNCGKRFSVMSNLRRHQRIHERQRA